MAAINLTRQFMAWDESQSVDPEIAFELGLSRNLLSWDDIAAHRRVVILAEAGSGKTTEMQERARQQTAAGQFAFFAAVEDVGREGLEEALGQPDRARVASWRERPDENAWFFIDSVDEAKLNKVRLKTVFCKIADGITGYEHRAHIVLSGRLTDWEFRRDLELFNENLSIPKDLPLAAVTITSVRDILHQERPKSPTTTGERPLVVVMAPLDRTRAEKYAKGRSTSNLADFLKEIDTANLWRFARRPLDLGWLVDFWDGRKRLGSLVEMLDHSLKARLREPNPTRSPFDSLDEDRALKALERIGAALVFMRKTAIAIPDSELTPSREEPPVNLGQVLSDWPPQDHARLLTRAVFDPSTFGRVRLHNDNLGVVRAYLAARWLHRLRGQNLSKRELFHLLFATTYDIDVIRPSMRETAAWLALWDADVAREAVRREPRLLLTAGDPASLSLSLRTTVLEQAVAQLASATYEYPSLESDSLKRFCRPDMSDCIRRLWETYQDRTEVRHLLLRMIGLGELHACGDLAESVAFGTDADRYTALFAGRALWATASASTKRRYAEFVRDECASLSSGLVLEAVDGLFPQFLSVDDLLHILPIIGIHYVDYGVRFPWQAPRLIKRLENRTDMERLLRGLLVQLGEQPRPLGHIPDEREEAYFIAISAVACQLLEKIDPAEAPRDTIDAALTLAVLPKYSARSMYELRDIAQELQRSSARRRLTFWQAAERLGTYGILRRPVEHLWEIQLDFDPDLRLEDVPWLLEDGRARAAENERRLAINTAIAIWQKADRPGDLLSRIEQTARSDRAMQAAYDLALNPPPLSAASVEAARQIEKSDRRRKEESEEEDRRWAQFIDGLQRDPDQLRHFRPPCAEGMDSRVLQLWTLLSRKEPQTRYAIDSVASLEPLLGLQLAAALADALIGHWRLWQPKLNSTKGAHEHNQMSTIDCVGITGISLEAKRRADWAQSLSGDEAILAAGYATLEFNGFPSWLIDLARAQPSAVHQVLSQEIASELNDPVPRFRYDVLEYLGRAEKPIVELIAPGLLDILMQRESFPPNLLASILHVLVSGLQTNRDRLSDHVIDRFNTSDNAEKRTLFLCAGFALDPEAATSALIEKLDLLDTERQRELVEHALPEIFSNRLAQDPNLPANIPFESLERLVRTAFDAIRLEDDNNRLGEQVCYSPDQRDKAERARSAAFQQLVETPGRATIAALQRLEEDEGFPVPRTRLRSLVLARAGQDSECAPWRPSEPAEFERTSELAPSTVKDLQRLAMMRLDDMQDDLLNAEFAQGSTLQALDSEKQVQNWVADRLQLKQGRSYSVERESHVVDEKEPDVRFRAKASDARVPMEIKVAESWSLGELEDALSDQLCAKYLRAREEGHGILLLVHKRPRPKGWQIESGKFLPFNDVVSRLKALARKIRGASPDAPQPEIAVLDVSRCGAASRAARPGTCRTAEQMSIDGDPSI
jgi:hypothetical protein